MKNSFVIHFDNGRIEHFICPCCHFSVDDLTEPEKEITTYYSYRHTEANGWRYTKNIKYCPPKLKLGAWICPDCLKS